MCGYLLPGNEIPAAERTRDNLAGALCVVLAPPLPGKLNLASGVGTGLHGKLAPVAALLSCRHAAVEAMRAVETADHCACHAETLAQREVHRDGAAACHQRASIQRSRHLTGPGFHHLVAQEHVQLMNHILVHIHVCIVVSHHEKSLHHRRFQHCEAARVHALALVHELRGLEELFQQ